MTMPPTAIHIINHTHWDREWFLTSSYTSRWIPGLIERIEQLVEANPTFRYLFDGQTLVLEDLAAVSPGHLARAEALIRTGNLTVGPYYCQPDWKLTDGELLIRNLLYGQRDTQRHGGTMHTGWLVDTFGHISQAPQLHKRAGITTVYIWRGAPQLTPYLRWVGADGSELLAINLFGGYRNLYGISHAPEVAAARLHGEVERLRPYYPTPDIPLFDGYDLEDNPEDPLRFFAGSDAIDPALQLHESTPAAFAAHIAAQIAASQVDPAVVHGELNSGKYGATFPGTLSARIYLKVMAHDSMTMALRYAEPLAALAWLRGHPYASERFEQWSRLLLQNAVHDCICGVSIDLVHEKMEDIYRRVFDGAHTEVQDALAAILHDFADGRYTVSTTPFAIDIWQRARDHLVHLSTAGVGVFPIREQISVEECSIAAEGFRWENSHYTAEVTGAGDIAVGGAKLGALLVLAEGGDTYSDEAGAVLGAMHLTTAPTVIERSTHHAVVTFTAAWQVEERRADATVRITFDKSPLIRWQIDLDTRGSNLRVEAIFATACAGRVFAGMPFDVVQRPVADRDLLPRMIDGDLAKILLGQRELNSVTTFPFHGFVAIDDGQRTTAILAKGLHAYSASDDGLVRLPLQRSVEWLTAANLRDRIGDAGPFFYVPDGRGERTVRHELAVTCGDFRADSMTLQALNAAFQTPPLLVEHAGSGTRRAWTVLHAQAPMSALHVIDNQAVARLYNPTPTPQAVSATAPDDNATLIVEPKAIIDVHLPLQRHSSPPDAKQSLTQQMTAPAWRVGENQSRPDVAILNWLTQRIAELSDDIAGVEAALQTTEGADRLRLQHRLYVLGREQVESQLSLALNQRKAALRVAPDTAYLYAPDPEIAALGLELNRLRIMRRIFDYVVAALP